MPNNPKKQIPEPWDGSALSVKNRIAIAEELQFSAEKLTPCARPKPFVKSFNSFKEYETWRKKQNNPWLI